MKTSALVLALPLLLTMSGQAMVTLVEDNFDSYPDATVLTTSSIWANESGTGDFVTVSGGQISLTHGSGSREDVAAAFATQSVGVITATFDFSVSSSAFGGGTDFEYFTHFNTVSNSFVSRLDIQAPTAGGDYTFGISTNTSTAEDTATIDLTFGQTYSATLTFDLATGSSTATINGATVTGTSLGAGVEVTAFNFRQSDSSNDETITIDNVLVVNSVPEPSIALLGGLGLLGLLRRRR